MTGAPAARTVLMVRHASAGARAAWTGDDRLRPLDARGRRQAAGLMGPLAAHAPTALLSSPYLRCVQTLEPLAEHLGLAVDVREELAEGAGRGAFLRAIGEAPGTPVTCVHGDLVGALSPDPDRRAKGAVWVLELDRGGAVRAVEYLPPPA